MAPPTNKTSNLEHPATSKPINTPAHPSQKSTKQRLLTLRLSPSLLAQFPHSTPRRAPSSSKSKTPATPSAVSTPHPQPQPQPSASSPPAGGPSSSEPPRPDAADTPLDAIAREEGAGPQDSPAAAGLKRKASPEDGAAPAKQDKVDDGGGPKPRGKPGPKRRKGAGDGEGGLMASHKLGPKANQGAINAQLRALDRKGPPCRRWHRAGFAFKSFTGVKWEIPQWETPKRVVDIEPLIDGHSENTVSSENAKGEPPSSALQSEKSNNGGESGTPDVLLDAASSPAPGLTEEHIIAPSATAVVA